MKKITNTYVQFHTLGLVFGESWNEPIASTDPLKIEWPESAYAFNIFQRDDVIDGDKEYRGEAVQVGPRYYHPDSKVETLSEVEARLPNEQILLGNMRGNHWASIIWTRWGNWLQPFEPDKMEVLPKP